MRIFNKFKGTKGFISTWQRVIRFQSMRNQKEVERRVMILAFWWEYGDKAVKDAFGVSRRTLFRWQAVFNGAERKLSALDPKSTVPNRRRQRIYAHGLIEHIIVLRKEHPRIGKKKIAPLLKAEGFNVSESYIGRVLGDLKKRGLLPNKRKLSYYAKTGSFIEQKPLCHKKQRRPKGIKRGMEVDTLVRFIDGVKRYIYTAIDVEKRFAFAGAYTSHSSVSAIDFLSKLKDVLPYPLQELQTDNGSEFAILFCKACERLGITHYYTYPRSPKMNAHIERFNRTISEDFISCRRTLLRDDLNGFNQALTDWLLWYNVERPHESLGMLSPLRYIVSTLPIEECQRYWTSTSVWTVTLTKLCTIMAKKTIMWRSPEDEGSLMCLICFRRCL